MGNDIHTSEVMALLGISRRTVQAWVKQGKLRPGKDAQGRNTFTRADIESLMGDAQEVHTVTPASAEAPIIPVQFDPSRQIIVDLERYEGLCFRLAQLEAKVLMLEDKRPWWRRLFRR
jgi:hypothetical protein